MAPEVYKGQPYTSAVDIWALGVILYCMVCGSLLFEGKVIEQLAERIVRQDPVYRFALPDDLRDLLKLLLEKDPERRITISGILSHKWVLKNSPELIPFTPSKRVGVTPKGALIKQFIEETRNRRSRHIRPSVVNKQEYLQTSDENCEEQSSDQFIHPVIAKLCATKMFRLIPKKKSSRMLLSQNTKITNDQSSILVDYNM